MIITAFHSLTAFCVLTFFVFSHLAIAQQVDGFQHTLIDGKPSLRGSAIFDQSLWVTGTNNSVWVSQDGGKHWHDRSVKSSINNDFRDIAVFDTQTAIVMSVGSGKQSSLYKTTDAGKSWQLLLQNQDEAGFFDSIAFWDQDNGLLMGDPVDGYYVVKRTQDGGKTWTRTDKVNLPSLIPSESAFAASGNTLIVGKDNQAWLTTGGKSASVYHSNDGGLFWLRKSVPLYRSADTAGGYGLALNSDDDLFVVGGDYLQRDKNYPNMARYDVIKNRWKHVKSGDRGLRSAMACNAFACIATGKTGSDISYDQGNTWQPLANPKYDNTGYFTLSASNARFLFAGSEGKVAVLIIPTE